ncbi:Probable phytol kinase 3, chloroplastic [Linum perenne]
MASTTTKLNGACFFGYCHHHSPPSASSRLHSLFHPGGGGYRTSRVGFGSRIKRAPKSVVVATAMILHQDPLLSDTLATGLSGAVALSVLRLWEETAKRGIFDQLYWQLLYLLSWSCGRKLPSEDLTRVHWRYGFWILDDKFRFQGGFEKVNRKLVHISIGLVFMLCWPLFSSGRRGAIMAAIIPGANIIRMILIGCGMWKDEATVKSMSRFGDRRELLKGPLYYATAITLACAICWRTSPIAIAAICNLCAGDGMADIVGRRYGKQKLRYNKNKSIAGSISMASAGFLASVGYMHYFALLGYVEESWVMVLGFLIASLASAFVESLPISTELDDNLTVTLTCVLVGKLVF